MSSLQNTSICLLNEHQVAKTLGLSVATIRRWRLYGRGPKFIKTGAAVRYTREDFLRWLATRPSGGDTGREAAGE
ncbi:MAG TPA: helix-turn-helix domain-containing protein [Bryobacteraceae bacterium]|nr:helix-turn-helix domain-containing protein [Bryobacteraceae bacterium]